MAWTIKAALDSGIFDTVMVSTDSEEYARIAREWGAEVPFLRSKETSGDRASGWAVCREVLEDYRAMGREFDMFTVLQPTSPLRNCEDIRGAYELFEAKMASAIVSVCEVENHPYHMNILPEDLSLVGFVTEKGNRPRQTFPDYYRFNGAIYMVRTSDFPEDNNIYRSNLFAYVMPQHRSCDIDTKLDFVIAEAIIKNW